MVFSRNISLTLAAALLGERSILSSQIANPLRGQGRARETDILAMVDLFYSARRTGFNIGGMLELGVSPGGVMGPS